MPAPRECQSCEIEIFLGAIECPLCKGPAVLFNKPAPDFLKAAAARLALPDPSRPHRFPNIHYTPQLTVDELYASQPSPAGHSAVSTFLACPEQSRLRSLNVVRRVDPSYEGIVVELDRLAY